MRRLMRRITNGAVMAALRARLPAPPYSRRNAIIIETVGRRSGKRRRIPVGYVQDGARLVVVAEYGTRAEYVRNARSRGGRIRMFHDGRWKDASLQVLDDDPEVWLGRMNQRHASFVRRFATQPRAVAIAPA